MPPEPHAQDDDISSLERVREQLYSTSAPSTFGVPTLSDSAAYPVPASTQSWRPDPVKKRREPLSWAVKFLILAIVFFVFAGGVTAVLLIHGGRSISTDRIDIEANTPTSITSGTTVSITATIQNNNPVAITDTNFTVDLPTGTRQPGATSTPLDHYTDTLGTVPAGGSATRTVTAVLFGEEGQKLSIPMHLEYRTGASSAVFVKEKDYTVTISTSPIQLHVSTVSQTASGQPLTVAIQVISNATTPLENVAVVATLPSGFSVTGGTPAPTSPGFYLLGTLSPGQERDITLTGPLTAADQDTRTFTVTVGTAASAGAPAIDVPYTTAQALVAITKPLLGVTLALNHSNDSTLSAAPGEPINAAFTFVNSLSEQVQNAQITVRFSGNAFDPNGVQSANGTYNAQNGTISFTGTTLPGLKALNAGDTGSASFTLIPKSAASLVGVRSPSIKVEVGVSGMRASGGTVSSTLTRTVQFISNLSLEARASHTGTFTNTGPTPPQVGTETDYTLTFTATGSVNSVGGGTLTAHLPEYVRYTGQTAPADGSVTYDTVTRTITWHAPDVTSSAPGTLRVQVAYLPTSAQGGKSVPLATGISFTGVDRFTHQSVSATAQDVSVTSGS